MMHALLLELQNRFRKLLFFLEIVVNFEWKFKVDTSDAEKPVLIQLEYQDLLGGRATPAFLMAVILKHHIKTETGTKPTEVAFQCFGDFMKKDRRRIKFFLREACVNLNVRFRSIALFH